MDRSGGTSPLLHASSVPPHLVQAGEAPANSRDLNPVDFIKIWDVMQQTHLNNLDELKQRLIEVWSGLQRNTVPQLPENVSDCELVFAHMGDNSNVYFKTMKNSIIKLKSFTYQ